MWRMEGLMLRLWLGAWAGLTLGSVVWASTGEPIGPADRVPPPETAGSSLSGESPHLLRISGQPATSESASSRLLGESTRPTLFSSQAPAILMGPTRGSQMILAEDGYFDWPIGLSDGGVLVMGYGTYVVQNYGNPNPYYNDRAHTGVDMAYMEGGEATVGAPVYAAASGQVQCVDAVNYPGDIVVIQHDLPEGGTLFTMYGNLENVVVAEGQSVERGDSLGTILAWPAGVDNTHVHFEVREWDYFSVNNCYGPGYASAGVSPEEEGWRDPVATYYSRRPPFPGEVFTNPGWSVNVRTGPSTTFPIVATLDPSTKVTAVGVAADGGSDNNWWYEVQYDGENTGYTAGFVWAGWGSYINLAEPKRGGDEGSGCSSRFPATGGPGLGLIPVFMLGFGIIGRRRRGSRG